MKYVPFIAEKIRLPETEVVEAFKALPIIACQGREYDYCMDSARDLIGNRDLRDADILALAIALDVSLWSDDRDFEDIPGVTLLKTTDMFARMQDTTSH